MASIKKPAVQHPSARPNKLGLTVRDYEGSMSTLCAGCGHDSITAFRAARSPVGLMRRTEKTVITTYGRDTAVASTLFYRDSTPGRVGRQMQTWVRFPEGWKIVAAHVSIIDEPGSSKEMNQKA